MLNLIEIDLDHDIPGVHPAKQARSVRLRNSYIRAGIKLLNNKRLADISVSEYSDSVERELAGLAGSAAMTVLVNRNRFNMRPPSLINSGN